jgi:ElaA protein
MKEGIKVHWKWRKFMDFKDPAELYQVLALRSQVFVVEQDCVYLDLDGKDADALHLMGYIKSDQLVAYARVFLSQDPKAMPSIGRVVVDADYRGQGIASELMQQAIEYIHKATNKPTSITLSAQHHLVAFYEKLGFQVFGQPYDEDGILHIQMML